MDYKKKYKEAQKWIESIYSELSHEQQMGAEAFFPELKESEDEKIRKELTEFLKSASGGFLDTTTQCKTFGKWVAWLEKQGEKTQQTPQWMIDFLDDNRSKFASLMEDYDEQREAEGKLLAIIAWLEKQGKKETLCDKCRKEHPSHSCQDITALGRCALEKQDEQKPAWSEEGMNKPNGGIVMEDFNDGNGFYKVNLAYLNEEQVEQIEELVKRWGLQPKRDEDESIISDLLDYFDEDKCLKHEVNDIIKWLKTIKPQQKGWSENEIKMLDNLITYLDGRKDLLEEIKSTYIGWLKSLKERYTWKPSDEQMDALAWALSLAKNCGEENAFDLRTLYEQLKKLKGE